MYVIGTAGHVDHGKSSLIRALTGINPDRLREEQERGLTIELGFAWMTLPSGREVSIVDVPGHVRFVRHMLAGIGAVDLALVVIAADEGVMPQTQEHLDILDLLEVEHAVVALTKLDLVESDWVDLVEEEVREQLLTTSLGNVPIVRVSAETGEGLDLLQQALDRALDSVAPPADIGRPRLGIDRVFTMTGFGTVVTGTLLGGSLRIGDTLELVPAGISARVRGLQTHRQEVSAASPGTRVAVNLSGLTRERIDRGQVLGPPGRLTAVTAFDVALRVLRQRPLPHNLRVSVHTGASEAQGRVRILAGDEIAAGERGWAQVVLRSPVACIAGDLVVLRVSDETLAGGRIVALNPPRHRRRDPETIERLEQLATGTPESIVLAILERLELGGRDRLLEAAELDPEAFADAMVSLEDAGTARTLPADGGPLYITSDRLEQLAAGARAALSTYHATFPLRLTMPREELRSRLALEQRQFGAVLAALAPSVTTAADGVAEDGWSPNVSDAEREIIAGLEGALEAAGFQPPRPDCDPEIVAHLNALGRVVDCGNGVVLASGAFGRAQALVEQLLVTNGEVTLAGTRDALATNRRVAQALLEELDRRGVTRRLGERRVAGRPTAGGGATGDPGT